MIVWLTRCEHAAGRRPCKKSSSNGIVQHAATGTLAAFWIFTAALHALEMPADNGSSAPRQAGAEKPVEIVHARWGAGRRWTDVSRAMREQVRDGRYLGTVDANALGANDPAFGQAKSLEVVYRIGEQSVKKTFRDGDLVYLGDDSRVAADGSGLVLLEAKYGSGKVWVDVLERLKPMVKDGILSVKAEQAAERDPLPGVRKVLFVRYAINGKPSFAAAFDGQNLAVAAPPAAQQKSESGPPTASENWLRYDENGEPCEVTLAGGTVLKLDTYGDEYKTSESRAPINASGKGQTVLDYEAAGLPQGVGGHFLRLDVAGGKMYWIEIGPSGICNIRGSALNGQGPKILVELRYQSARGLAVDHERRSLYWGNHAATLVAFNQPASARQAIWKAGLDGSKPRPVFSGLQEPGGIAVEPKTGDIFYFDGLKLVRGTADGAKETVVKDSLVLPFAGSERAYRGSSAAFDQSSGSVYWSHGESFVARIGLDGADFRVLLGSGKQIPAVALDPHDEKLYWLDSKSQEIWRADLDGARAEVIAVGLLSASSIDVDPKQRYVYWTDSRRVRTTSYGLIRKLKLPAPLKTTSKPAPPLITTIEPAKARPGATITLRGKHLSDAKRILLIGDDGRQSDAKATTAKENELIFALPPRREGVARAVIVVQGPGGVTLTLPRDTTAIKRDDHPVTNFDRFQAGSTFCFAVEPGAAFAHVEGSVVYAPGGAQVRAGGRGNVVLFIKDAAKTAITDTPGVIVYHEPLAQVTGRGRVKGNHEHVSVPAIRPSFVETLFEYEE